MTLLLLLRGHSPVELCQKWRIHESLVTVLENEQALVTEARLTQLPVTRIGIGEECLP